MNTHTHSLCWRSSTWCGYYYCLTDRRRSATDASNIPHNLVIQSLTKTHQRWIFILAGMSLVNGHSTWQCRWRWLLIGLWGLAGFGTWSTGRGNDEYKYIASTDDTWTGSRILNSNPLPFTFCTCSGCNVCSRYSNKFSYDLRERARRGGLSSGTNSGALFKRLVLDRPGRRHPLWLAPGWQWHRWGNELSSNHPHLDLNVLLSFELVWILPFVLCTWSLLWLFQYYINTLGFHGPGSLLLIHLSCLSISHFGHNGKGSSSLWIPPTAFDEEVTNLRF